MRKNKIKYNRGEMGLGAILLLVVIGCFVIWVLTGGPAKKDTTKAFVNPYTNPINPGDTYGPTAQ